MPHKGPPKGCKRKHLVFCSVCGKEVYLSHRRIAEGRVCSKCRTEKIDWPEWIPEIIQQF